MNDTEYKEMKEGIAFVIVQKYNGHNRYFTGSYTPEIGITHHVDGAAHYNSFEFAEKELKELELDKFNPPFIVEEHEWI